MPQEYLGDVYLGADCVPVPEILPSESQALSPHQIVPMLIGSTIEAIERELVLQTLARCHGNRTHAARLLGISLRTLRNKLRAQRETAAANDGQLLPIPTAESDETAWTDEVARPSQEETAA